MIGVMEERPPFVRFERRAQVRRQAGPPAGDGSVYYVDVDFAIITPMGTKEVVEKPVKDWFAYLQQMINMRRYNPAWLQGFKDRYEAWTKQQDLPPDGFPVANWPAATASEIRKLRELHILTVEDLAALPEEGIARLGMGGRSLKQRAMDWVTGSKDTAPLISKLDSLTVTVAQLSQRVEELTKENTALKGAQQSRESAPAPRESLESRLEAARGDDEIDFDKLERL